MIDRPVRLALLVAAATALALVLASPALAWGRHVSIDSSGGEEACAALRIRFDGVAAVKEEQKLTVPGGTPLKLHAPDSSGLRVSGWDRADFEVTACKAARDASTLAGMSVSASNGTISVDGVDGEDAAVFFFVKAPKGAVLDLAAENGPMTLRDLSGALKARLANGPLTLAGVHGTVDVEAENGPVSLRDGSGDWTLRVTNGPLSARLAGAQWEGKGLVAETVNGPLTIRLDPGFGSGLRVSAAAHAPFRCRAAACANARRAAFDVDEDGEQVFELGSGEPVVRLSTVNGPVTVKDDAPGAD